MHFTGNWVIRSSSKKLRIAHDYSAETAISKTGSNVFTLNLEETLERRKYFVGGAQS